MSFIFASVRPGDRICVVAPSGAFERERLLAGVEILTARGFTVDYDEGIFSRQRYLAGSDDRRVAELLAALHHSEAKAIWAARGGFGAAHLLANFSAEMVAKAGKVLIGYSDASALHALWARAQVGSVHAANVVDLATWDPSARDELFGLLGGAQKQSLKGTLAHGPRGAVSGVLLGGNLTVLGALAGTGQLPSFAGALVFFEDVGERPYRLDRVLTQLVASGAFAQARGFVIGQLSNCEDANPALNGTAWEAVLGVLAPLQLPIVAGVNLGHEASSRAVCLGATYTLDLATQELRRDEV